MVHSVDLGTGLSFADLPEGFLVALCQDIVAKRNGPAVPKSTDEALLLHVTDVGLQLELHTDSEPNVIRGGLADVATFLAGRATNGSLEALDGRPLADLGPCL